MTNGSDDGRRGLEEEFFARQNRELTDKLKAQKNRKESLEALAELSGIGEASILESLYDSGVTPASFTALSLVPLVLVAWADGAIDSAEREAILKAAASQKIDPSDSSYTILNSWLDEAPKKQLFEVWKQYVRALKKTMPNATFAQLQQDILGRAQAVATATGGFLGLGSKISAAESEELKRLQQVFTS